MKTNTKVQSLNKLNATPARDHQYGIILKVLDETPRLSRSDIADVTDLRLSSVCARVNEMMKRGWLVENGTKYDLTTNRNVTCLELV